MPVVAIFRGQGTDLTLELARRAWEAGVDLVEVPVQTAEAFAAFEAVVAEGRNLGKDVGAGTVLTVAQVEAVAAAGGAFAVAPGFDPVVVRAAADAGLPFLPGVATASEVGAALALGSTWLKAFPARELGATWARALKGPFPQARFVATGGISADNAVAFLSSGYDAVALGTAFATQEGISALGGALDAWRSR
jgi:Entner-Doudoroff aldolase